VKRKDVRREAKGERRKNVMGEAGKINLFSYRFTPYASRNSDIIMEQSLIKARRSHIFPSKEIV